MPVINVSLFNGRSHDDKNAICKTIIQEMKSAFKIEHNNFHCRIHEYSETEMIVPPVSSKNYISIEITFLPGKSVSEKEYFYKNLQKKLLSFNIKENDIIIILQEPILENWYIRGKTGIEIKSLNQTKTK